MPPSGTVGTPPDDAADDVPLRMPDTSGTKPNLAEFRGQTLTLDPADQKNFTKLHFFGTTADGSGGGTFTLKYDTGPDQTVAVAFADWCATPTAAGAHRDRPADPALPDDRRRRCALLDLPRRDRQSGADAQARLGHAAAGDDRRRHRHPGVPDGAHARGGRRAPTRCPTSPGSTSSRTTTPRPSPTSRSAGEPSARRLVHDRAADHDHRHRRGRRLRRRADPVPDQRRHAAALHRPVQPHRRR